MKNISIQILQLNNNSITFVLHLVFYQIWNTQPKSQFTKPTHTLQRATVAISIDNRIKIKEYLLTIFGIVLAAHK